MRVLYRFILIQHLLFSPFALTFGQNGELSNKYIDSLKHIVETVSDSAKVDLLNQISYNYYYYFLDSADDYAEQAMELAKSLDYKKGLSESQRLTGISLKAQNKEREAIEWLYKGLKTAQSINYYQGIADNLNSLGIFYKSVDDYDQANSFFLRSVKYQKLAGNLLREGILYTNIGSIYLLKNDLDSSMHYYKKSELIIDSIDDEKWTSMVKSQIGKYWIKAGDLQKAEEYSKKAVEISLKTGQTFHLRQSYQNLAEIYLLRKNYKQAQKYADMAIEISNDIGFLPFLVETNKIAYRLKKELNQYKAALDFHEKYAIYRDSVRREQIHSESNLLKYEIELEQKEKENLLLRKEKETQEAQNIANEILIQRQTIIGISFFIILILVSILAGIFFYLRQKERDSNTKLLASNKELEEQKEELSATLQMVEHLNAQLQAQNNTLNKIAIVSITDLEGHIISVNENFCDVSGFSRDELLGNNHNILNSGEHSTQDFSKMWKTINDGNTWRGELKNKKKTGEYFWADTAIAPILNDEGNPKQFFSVQFEITKRKNYLDQLASKRLELEDLNKLKDKLLSIVSHDFRSPLNSLRGTLTLFLRGAISNEELSMLTESLVEKLDNTYNLLENLLNWAKSQMQGMKVYMKEIDLQVISKDCIDLLTPIADKKLVTIKSNIIAPISAFADNEMVKLVIRNLMSNAIKFTTAGNEITVDAMIDEGIVTVSIKDDGLGISNEDQDKLFKLENFSTSGTSNERGMGLGLLLCKDFVEKNNGKIWFESELQKGSTFFFSLPVKEPIEQQILT